MRKRRTTTGGRSRRRAHSWRFARRARPSRGFRTGGSGHKRLKWAVGSGAILGAALVVATAAVYIGQRNSQPEQTGAAADLRASRTGAPVDRTLSPEQEIALLKSRQMELAERVLKDLPSSGDACILMGDLQRRLGRSAKAVEFWQRGLELSPRRVDAYHSLGTVAAEKGEFDQAIAFWRKGLEIDPQTPGLHRVIGRALIDLGRYDEAAQELQEEIRLAPQSAESHCLLGDALLQQQDYEGAKACYAKAIELQPKYAGAYYGLSTACAKLGQSDKATECRTVFTQLRAGIMTDRGYGHSPADDLARTRESMVGLSMEAAGLYGAAGKTAIAEELLKQATAVDPNDAAPIKKLAAFFHATGRIPDALAQCERIRQLEPNDPACHLLIGTLALQLRQADRAEAAFRRFIILAPNEAAGYRELARLYLNTGKRLAEARNLAGKAVELEPVAENYFILGQACQRARDRQAALAALQKALELAPGNREYQQMYDLIRNGR